MISLALVSWLVASIFRLDVSPRWYGLILAAVIFGGGFVIDAVIEPPMTSKIMVEHGYSRCPSRDHKVGNGKSSVWFEDYALSHKDCLIGPPRTVANH